MISCYFFRLICKNTGVLFENDLLQIGCKCEFRQNLGRIHLYFGNKTQFPFKDFSTSVEREDQTNSVTMQMQPMTSQIDGGAQQQLTINIECINEFNVTPEMQIYFTYVKYCY